MSDELKPCPFCGSPAVIIDRTLQWDDYSHKIPDARFDVGCTNSDCFLCDGADWWLTEELAVKAWNTRADRPPCPKCGEPEPILYCEQCGHTWDV